MNASEEKTHYFAIFLSWLAVAAVAAFIYYQSSRSGLDFDTGSDFVARVKRYLAIIAQKLLGRPVDVSPIGHFAEYFLFGCVLANALRWHTSSRRALIAALVLAALYAVTDEYHQSFVPLRACDPADWSVDTVAAMIGAAFTLLVTHKRKR